MVQDNFIFFVKVPFRFFAKKIEIEMIMFIPQQYLTIALSFSIGPGIISFHTDSLSFLF